MSDTILCLKANSNKLYHIGIGEAIVKSTLSTANENRDWRIFSDFAWVLIKEAKQLYVAEKDLELSIDNPVFAIDASTIDMCLSLFQWANFRSTKAGIKLHVQLDLRSAIPEFIQITPAAIHEVNILDGYYGQSLPVFQRKVYHWLGRIVADIKLSVFLFA